MTTYYLDTPVALRALLGHSPSAADWIDVLSLVPITDGVLAAAEAIEPHLKTLDAIHLGSVIAAGPDATIVTHDPGMAAAAAAIGYPTLDPVTEA